MPDRNADIFVMEFVVGWGFINGIWVYAGIDPESALLGALYQVLQQIGSPYG